MIFGLFSGVFAIATALLFIALYVFAFAFMFWMAVDAAKHDKFWWIIVVIIFPFVGAVIYYFTEKKKMYEKVEKNTPQHHQAHIEEVHLK